MPTLVFSANTGADFSTVENDGIRSSGASGVNSGVWDPGVGFDTMLWRPTDNFNTTAIPGEITGAVFRIWQFQAFGTSSITVHENLRPWEKSGGTPSWTEYAPSEEWTTPGALGSGDRSASPIGFEETPNSVDLYIEIELDAATLEAWRQAGSAPANGIQLRGPEGGFSAYRTNDGDDGERPELVITYAEAGTTVSPEAGSLTLSGEVPAIQAGGNVTTQPGAGDATLEGQAPTIATTANVTVLPGAGAATLTGQAATVVRTDNRTVQPGAGQASLTGQEPAATVGDSRVAQPGAGQATLTGELPAIARTENRAVQPGSASLALAGAAPDIPTDRVAQPGAADLSLTGRAPTIRVRPKSRPVNLADDPRLIGKHRNVRMKGLESPAAPPAAIEPPAIEQPTEDVRPRAPGLAAAAIPLPPTNPPEPAPQPLKAAPKPPEPAKSAPAPVEEPYQSDLDPFYEPPTAPAAPADAGLAETVAELRAQVQALAELVTELRKPPAPPPYQSDLDPFYEPVPEQMQPAAPSPEDLRAENRNRAEVIARSLLN
jgi:hypothetical protein